MDDDYIKLINYANIEECECCHDYFSILNIDNINFIIITENNKFLCKKCSE